MLKFQELFELIEACYTYTYHHSETLGLASFQADNGREVHDYERDEEGNGGSVDNDLARAIPLGHLTAHSRERSHDGGSGHHRKEETDEVDPAPPMLRVYLLRYLVIRLDLGNCRANGHPHRTCPTQTGSIR